MKYLKKQDGILSAIIAIILFLIIALGLFFILDMFGYIDVPDEYSITKFLESSNEEIYKGEPIEKEEKKIKKKVKDRDYSNVEGNFSISDPVESNNDNNDNSYDLEEYDDIDFKRFYYSQLNDYGKLIYNGIVDNFDNMKKGDYTINFGKAFNDLLHEEDGSTVLNSSFQSAVNAVLLDNPEVFFLDISKLFLFTRSTTYAFFGTTYEVSVGPNNGETYFNESFSMSEVYNADRKLNDIKKDVIENLTGNKIDKIKQIHDYLVENLEYDSEFSTENVYNIYGALITKSPVCEGYAKAFKFFMDEIDIPCVVICGTAQNSKGEIENHAWNYVYIDNNWYAIDVTWDDPIVIGNGRLSDESKYKYYLKGSDFIFKDHTENGNVVDSVYFEYPSLSRADY